MKKIILLTTIIMLMACTFASAKELQISDYKAAEIFVGSVVGEDMFPGAEDEPVERGDFVTAVAKLFKQNREYTGEPLFTDVPKAETNYNAISNACVDGWVSKSERFLPYDSVKVTEAVKILIWAADYHSRAENSGGYPNGYMLIAQQMDLLDGVALSGNDEITVRDAVMMFSNVLNAEAIGIGSISEGNVQYDFLEKSIVEELYGLESIVGVVTQINKRSLVFEGTGDKDIIKIDGNIYTGTGFDHKWLGYNVKAYYDKDGNIVAIVPYKNTTVQVDIKDFVRIDGTRFVYEDADREKDKKLDEAYKVMCNDVRVGALSDDYYKDLNGSFTLVDNNNDGKYDVVFVESYEYAIIDNIDLAKSQIGLMGTNALLDFVEAEESKITSVGGEVLELFELRRGQYVILKKSPYIGTGVVSSYVPDFFEVRVGNTTLSGKITGFKSSENLIFIDGTGYKISKLFRDNYMSDLTVGNEVMYATGFGEDLVYAEKIMASGRFGYVLKLYTNDSDETYFMKLLADTGVVETYQFADKVYVDGVKDSSHRVYTTLGGTTMNRQLIRYTLNGDGLIYKIDLSEDASTLPYGAKRESDNNLLKYTETPTTIRYRSGGNIFVPKFSIDGAVIFKVPQVSDPAYEDYEVLSLNSLQGDQPYTVDVFNINEYGAAGALLLYTTDTKPVRITANSYLVESVSTVVNAEGDVGRQLHVWLNGTYYDFFISEDVVVENSADNSITHGDIVRIWTRHGILGDKVQRIILDIDNTDSGIVCNESAKINMHSVGNILTGANHIAGYIYAVGETGMVIGLNSTDNGIMNFDWSNVQVCRYTNSDSTNVAYIDTARGKIESGTIDSLRTYQAFGTDCHYAIIKMSSDTVSTVYIYQ